jgi:hypothetical protein
VRLLAIAIDEHNQIIQVMGGFITATQRYYPRFFTIHYYFTGQPTKGKVNEDLFLDKPLHVIQNHSKLAYSIQCNSDC